MPRKIELKFVERERVIRFSAPMFCPVCQNSSEFLTVRQAAACAQVRSASVRRWLANNRAHGFKTCGGQHRVCKNSLFRAAD